MIKRIALVFAVIVGAVLGVSWFQPDQFHYERSGIINASPGAIYPYLSDLHLGSEWSPYEKLDPQMKRTFKGAATEVGAIMEFEGNDEVGAGRMEIVATDPDRFVELELEFFRPFKGVNRVRYVLTPEPTGTRFTWIMTGKNPFLSKIVCLFLNIEKMIGDQFEAGIKNLKDVVENSTGPNVTH